jgi:PIN domain nuclease of toxin-antitoxin system
VEVGKLREAPGRSLAELARYPRWKVDNLPSEELFNAAMSLSWTRDPFDRLIVAHARQRRWKLATGDAHLLEHLPPEAAVEL